MIINNLPNSFLSSTISEEEKKSYYEAGIAEGKIIAWTEATTTAKNIIATEQINQKIDVLVDFDWSGLLIIFNDWYGETG